MEASPTRKELLLGGGHLLALWTLAFVQPLLDLLGDNPDFFVARGNGPADILILAFGLVLVPPLLLLCLEATVARFSGRIYRRLHLALLAVIATFLFIPLVAKLLTGPTLLVVLAAAVPAALLAWNVRHPGFMRNLLDLLIVAPVVILAIFVFLSPTSRLIFPASGEVALNSRPGNDHPVVLVIFDELGTSDLMGDSGTIQADRFPNLARLARTSTWYLNHSTTDFLTPRAVPGILTGRIPPDDALPVAGEQPVSIFTLLGRDRPLHVMEPVTALCPDSLCPAPDTGRRRIARLKALWDDLKYVEGRLVLPPGVADRLPDVSTTFQGFGGATDQDGPERAERFFLKEFGTGPEPAEYSRFVRRIPDSRRGLTVMHLPLPHQPWRFTPDGRRYNSSPIQNLSEPADDRWLVNGAGIATVQARMYTQTGLADRLIGELRETLETRDLWDDAIVVVTADHGISFEGGGVARRRVDARSMGEVANPPLFIKYPGQRRGKVSRRHALTLDILPTIMRAVGAGHAGDFDGVPLQGPVPDRPVTVKDVVNGDREVSVPVRRMAAQRNRALRRARRRLGNGPLFTLGPAPGLVGEAVPADQADGAGDSPGTVNLDEPRLWDDVDPRREPVPVFVTGTAGRLAEGATLAITVNGTVRGTAKTFEFDGVLRFGTLIDPASLRRGRNEIGIHAVRGDRLTRLGGN